MKDIRYWNPELELGQVVETKFIFNITGAKAVKSLTGNAVVYTAADAIAAQSTIDTFLGTPTGTTSEFNYLAFDATSMGTAALAFICNMNGQVDKLVAVRASVNSGTAGVTQAVKMLQPTAAGLTNTSLSTQFAKGANGNVAGRIVVTNLDGFTSGTVTLTLFWRSK